MINAIKLSSKPSNFKNNKKFQKMNVSILKLSTMNYYGSLVILYFSELITWGLYIFTFCFIYEVRNKRIK